MKEQNKDYALKTLERLIEASKDAIDLLIEEISKPLIEEDDAKRRQAIKAKRECFEDCQEILLGIKNLEDRINEGKNLIEEKKDFKGDYRALKNVREIKPTIKHYLRSQFVSGFLDLEEDDYAPAIFMPVAQWKKAGQSQVWKDSRKRF